MERLIKDPLLSRDAFFCGILARDGQARVICGARRFFLWGFSPFRGKLLRSNHVQTARHRMHGQVVVLNGLSDKPVRETM